MGGGVRHEGTVGAALPAPRGAGVSLGNSAVGMAAADGRERCEAEVSAGGL